MKSFGEKKLEALALIEPQKNDTSFARAGALAARACESDIGLSTKKPVKWLRAGADAYRRHRERSAAKFKLYAMSDWELRDIGLTRSQIDHAVEGTMEKREPKIPGFFKSAIKKFLKARKARETYVQLTMMDNRQLTDIGLTRGDLQAFQIGIIGDFANSNQVRSINHKDHRRAG